MYIFSMKTLLLSTIFIWESMFTRLQYEYYRNKRNNPTMVGGNKTVRQVGISTLLTLKVIL